MGKPTYAGDVNRSGTGSDAFGAKARNRLVNAFLSEDKVVNYIRFPVITAATATYKGYQHCSGFDGIKNKSYINHKLKCGGGRSSNI